MRFKSLLIIVFFMLSFVVSAKDFLIPAFIDQNGYFNGTLFDYGDLSKEEKNKIDNVKSSRWDYWKDVGIKKIYPKDAVPDGIKNPYNLILSQIIPQPKPIQDGLNNVPERKVVIEDIFHNPNFALQNSLSCPITPFLKKADPNHPKSFSRSNNARRITKSPLVAKGPVIYVIGRVTDVDCVPVQGALVRLWQANAYGAFNHMIKELDSLYDRDFASTASFITDNTGSFSFITVLPGRSKDIYAPNLDFVVTHKEFPNIATKLFFPDNKFNKYDGRFMSLDPVGRELVTGIIIPVNPANEYEGYYFIVDIVLNGVSRFRS